MTHTARPARYSILLADGSRRRAVTVPAAVAYTEAAAAEIAIERNGPEWTVARVTFHAA